MVTFDGGASTGDLNFSRVRYADTTTTFTVAASSDDATEGYNAAPGDMWLAGTYDRNRATTVPTTVRDTGTRFANVTVPAGATVTAAYFEAYFYDDNSGDGLPPLNDDIDCTVYAHNTDNSSTFTSTTSNITDTAQRPRTSASVPWQKDELAGNYSMAASWAGPRHDSSHGVFHSLPADQVHVHVKNRLTGIRTRIRNDAVSGYIDPFAFCQLSRHAMQVPHQFFIAFLKHVDRVDMPVGHDQNMCRCNRVDVAEGRGILVAKNDRAGDVSGDDPTEEAVFSHGVAIL